MKIRMEVDLRNSLLQVRDQGARPTCLAHALTISHEHVLGSKFLLSPEYLHYFSTGGALGLGCSADAAMAALKADGQPREDACPYFALPPTDEWSPPKHVVVFRRNSALLKPRAELVSQAVRDGRVPVIGISLPRSFFAPTRPWVILPGTDIRGLHAVAAVGVGDGEVGTVVLVRNSWGSAWGDRGHAYLTQEFLQAHLKCAIILEAGEVS